MAEEATAEDTAANLPDSHGGEYGRVFGHCVLKSYSLMKHQFMRDFTVWFNGVKVRCAKTGLGF